MKGTVSITLDGATLEDTERFRLIVHQLFEGGFFSIKGGSFTANFDENGSLEAYSKTLHRKTRKPALRENSLAGYKVEITDKGLSTAPTILDNSLA